MPSTYSPLKIELPATGEQSGTWGNTTNTNLGTALEEAITGSANVTFASGNVTLTLTDTNASQPARNLRLNLIGVTGGSTRTLTVPAIKKLYLVSNNCADAIIVGNATGATVTVPAGNNIFVYNDGTDVLNAITYITSLNAVSVAAGSVTTTQVDITAQGDLRLQDTTGGQFVALQAPGTIASSYTLTLPVDDGTSGQALITDGNGVLSWSTEASGDVYGPASATDNAIARFDLTTGKIIQNSVVTIADSTGNMAGVGTLSSGAITTTGVLTVPAGTVSAPAITTTGDTNTGIFFPAADTIAFTEGGVESMRITSDGRVGIGTTIPSNQLEVGGEGILRLRPSAENAQSSLYLNATTTLGSSYRADIEIPATGGIVFETTGSLNTAPTERMRIDSNGNVGINNASPSSYNSSADNLVVGATTGNNGITISSDSSSQGSLFFADGTTGGAQQAAGYLIYVHTTDIMALGTANTERIRITSAGDVGIGTTVPAGKLAVTGGTTIASLTDWNSKANSVFSLANAAVRFGIGYDAADHALLQAFDTSNNARNLNLQVYGGNVGIGTNSSTAKLDVTNTNAVLASTGIVRIAASETTQDSGGQITFANAGARRAAIAGRQEEIGGSSGYLQFGTRAGTGDITERMRITSAGRVGIGTSSPNQLFDVSSAGESIIAITSTGAGGKQYNLISSPTAGLGTGIFSIYDRTNNITRIAIDNNGLVGIGNTLVPEKLLSVYDNNASTTTTTGIVVTNFNGTTNTRSGIAFKNFDNYGAAIWSPRTGGTTGNLIFATNGGAGIAETNVTERMRIDSSGKVGIGTSSPLANRLHIVNASAIGGVPAAGTYGGPVIIGNDSTAYGLYVGTIDSGAGYLQTQRGDSATTYNLLLQPNGGNVGIGVVPSASLAPRLQVASTFSAATASAPYNGLLIESTDAQAADKGGVISLGGLYDASSGVTRFAAIAGLKENGTSGNFAGYLAFYSRANGSSPAERMRITSGGDVGIGLTNPGARLSVLETISIPVVSTATASLELGIGRSGNGFAFIDLVGDATYADFGFRAIRGNDGANTGTSLIHRGTGNFLINTVESAPIVFNTASAERMRITSTGNVGIGRIPSAWSGVNPVLEIGSGTVSASLFQNGANDTWFSSNLFFNGSSWVYNANGTATQYHQSNGVHIWFNTGSGTAGATVTPTERMRLTAGGQLLVGSTVYGTATQGSGFGADGFAYHTRSGDTPLVSNRLTNDGTLISLQQDSVEEGSITVSGTTVSYNGGHLSRWSQLPDGSKDDTILKGTVMSNLDDMCVWEKNGVVAENEQLNKMKVSDVEGDTNVAGVFVNWTIDVNYGVDDMNVAMTGDMIIRIADDVVVQKGDLLMSAGDGTAKPQGDDIVRSKTIAKVTSNYVTCTYADGSYCVPCVLMAC